MREIAGIVLQAGIVAKIVLVILLLLSVLSWAIILDKSRRFRRVRMESDKFLKIFKSRPAITDLYMFSREFKYSPFSTVTRKVYHELKFWNGHPAGEDPVAVSMNQSTVKEKKSSMAPVIHGAIIEEMSGLEKNLVLLSTIVTISPFLGLLGTVWGIMSAFLNIGIQGSADITAVGPGIAEALITTIAGLAVAIPALFAHNYFADQLRKLDDRLEIFSDDLTVLLERSNPE